MKDISSLFCVVLSLTCLVACESSSSSIDNRILKGKIPIGMNNAYYMVYAERNELANYELCIPFKNCSYYMIDGYDVYRLNYGFENPDGSQILLRLQTANQKMELIYEVNSDLQPWILSSKYEPTNSLLIYDDAERDFRRVFFDIRVNKEISQTSTQRSLLNGELNCYCDSSLKENYNSYILRAN